MLCNPHIHLSGRMNNEHGPKSTDLHSQENHRKTEDATLKTKRDCQNSRISEPPSIIPDTDTNDCENFSVRSF